MDAAPDTILATNNGSPGIPRRLVLELALEPEEARRLPFLLRGPLALRGTRRRRPSALRLVWHDTPDFDLAADGLALLERQQGRQRTWRLERTLAEAGALWSPGISCPVLAEAVEAAALDAPLPAPLAPVVGFEGQSRLLPAPDAVEIALLSGTLRTATATKPCCRAVLTGPAEAVAALADRLAGRLRLSVPGSALAAEAVALAGYRAPRRRHSSPAPPPDRPVGEAFAYLAAQLAAAILYEAEHAGPAISEPVHQMRVAVRRLRSAIGLFGKAVRCPELTASKAGLRLLAKVLGPARDWDVFTAGTGRAVAAGFADDRAVQRLLKAAELRRLTAYATLRQYLTSAEFRRMSIGLAVLAAARPWEKIIPTEGDQAATRQAELRVTPIAGFAARALERRLRPLRAADADIGTLPATTLHGLRLRGKRLRYAAEFFMPLFPGRGARRFVRRLTTLQERLGHLNDGAVATGLMAKLGAERGYAGGVVRGFVAAQAVGARAQIGQAWRRFHRLDPFWD